MKLNRFFLAGLLMGASALAAPDKLADELKAMADTERAFARTSVEKGIRESFYEFFAEEGIAFRPHPVKLREETRKLPPQTARPSVTLDWEPAYGDIAASAELGWLTGPFVVTDQSPEKRAPQYGFYSSVWKKQPDGTWRVLIDLGVSTPPHAGPLPRNQFTAAPREKSGKGKPGADLQHAEAALAQDAARGIAAAYEKHSVAGARVHRNGMMPLTTPAAIRAYFAAQPAGTWETLHAEAAASDDLGYTYGKYELKKDGATTEKGYYMRVWKRDPRGAWKLVFDVTNPLPPEAK